MKDPGRGQEGSGVCPVEGLDSEPRRRGLPVRELAKRELTGTSLAGRGKG